MKKSHQTRQAAYLHFVQVEKLPPAAAKTKAEEYWTGLQKSRVEELDNMSKSIGATETLIDEALTVSEKFAKELDSRADDIEQVDVSMKKSIRALSDADGEVDGMKFVGELAKSTVETLNMIHSGFSNIQKSIAAVLNAQKAQAGLHKSLLEDLQENQLTIDSLSESVESLRVGIMRKSQGVVTSGLSQLRVAAAPVDDEDDPIEAIAKSIGPTAVEKYLVDKAVECTDVTQRTQYFTDQEKFRKGRMQTNSMAGGLAVLSKSRVKEIATAFHINFDQ